MKGWGRVGWVGYEGVGWGGVSCRCGVGWSGWVMKGWGGVGQNSNSKNNNS